MMTFFEWVDFHGFTIPEEDEDDILEGLYFCYQCDFDGYDDYLYENEDW